MGSKPLSGRGGFNSVLDTFGVSSQVWDIFAFNFCSNMLIIFSIPPRTPLEGSPLAAPASRCLLWVGLGWAAKMGSNGLIDNRF